LDGEPGFAPVAAAVDELLSAVSVIRAKIGALLGVKLSRSEFAHSIASQTSAAVKSVLIEEKSPE